MTERRTCSVDGCDTTVNCKGLCKKHYSRLQRNGGPLILRRQPARLRVSKGYFRVGHKDVHTEKAEAALGRPLPPGAMVHHADGNKLNNENTNLVICPSHAYHMMLHRRMRAMEETGNPNLRKCVICKQWDDPANLYFPPSVYAGKHKKCDAEYHAALNARKRAERQREASNTELDAEAA